MSHDSRHGYSGMGRSRAHHDSSDSSMDSSPTERSHKKHDNKHKTRERSRDRHRSRSTSRDRHRSRSTSRDRHDRSRSKSKGKLHKKKKDKHKIKKKRARSSSIERPLTAEDLELLKEQKRKDKEICKALETPEEKRSRRLEKKEKKERKRKAQMGWDEEYMGYTNADNPFGDEHLLDTFVWGKKMEKEGKKDLTSKDLEKMHKYKMIENKIELEKVKKRRLEREKEREERETEREMMQRDKEAEYFREWETQEDSFHLQQAKLRSKIRIEDSRAKPIDLLAKYISAEEDDFALEMHEPYTYLHGLTITDLEDLLEDIRVYMELEQGHNAEYWRDITIITDEEISKLKKMDPNTRDFISERRAGMNQSVAEDVKDVFKGKSLEQLALLQQQILSKMKGGEGVDVGYWESLLQQLRAHMARKRLSDQHQEQLRSKLFKLKQEQGIESQPLFPIVREEQDEGRDRLSDSEESDSGNNPSTSALVVKTLMLPPQTVPPIKTGHQTEAESMASASQLQQAEAEAGSSVQTGEEEEEQQEEESETVLTEEDVLSQSYEDYEAGQYSPRLVSVVDLEASALVYDPEDDLRRLDYARRQVLSTGQAKKDSDAELVKRAREGMTDDEAQFSVEVPLEKQTLLWSDKYRPRKPRFFNRVHTGFEWNKYNQTHYDIDNPPPKIVQGYKFNIFYPDLIDKTRTPEYTLTSMEDNKDFGLLQFRAGPPYEDIAFKIVNREWEYSYKRGFRCQFHNNIFQLWFHFKRYRYRR